MRTCAAVAAAFIHNGRGWLIYLKGSARPAELSTLLRNFSLTR